VLYRVVVRHDVEPPIAILKKDRHRLIFARSKCASVALVMSPISIQYTRICR